MRDFVRLELSETPTDILERELLRARESARRCEEQGSWLHTWNTRADAIKAVLDARIVAVREPGPNVTEEPYVESRLFKTTERLAKAAFANQACQYRLAKMKTAVAAFLAAKDAFDAEPPSGELPDWPDGSGELARLRSAEAEALKDVRSALEAALEGER